ncbi:hypothetical protein PSEUBRA_000989 [Kalmanozyma brasiliensis GHG001]|uniref:uncharacterized protein n=1 Tax=Kalmanozyma brasiliensis (strain GHG001) TaxID=1365824 RepID=UPI001CE9F546|nr:uncharacterized protein PSEUBRA_000989 [Kalmanozyma brasiliensis GHG001]KAF6766872.1 hypothetical protein PSEUBRA_000989 [Kalmanozyma brasiliensis GHG001]
MYTASPSSALVAPLATQARSCGDSNNGQQGSRWQCAAVQYHVPVPQEYLVPFQTAEQAQLMLTRWSMDEGYLLKGGGGYASYHYLRCNRYNTGPLPYCQYSIRLGPAENSSGWEIDTMSDVHNHPSSLPVRQPAAASITAPVTQSSTASDTVLPSSTPTPQPRDQQQSASVNPVPVLAASPTPRVKISLKRSSADPQNSSSAAIVPSPAPLTSSALTELHNKTSVPAQRGLSSTNVTSGPTVYPLPSRSNSDQPAGHTSSTNISVAVASSSTRVPSPSTVHKTADSPEQASADQRMQVPDGTSEPLAKRARTDSADEPTSHVTAEGDPTPEGGAVQQDGNPSCDLVRAILNIPQKEFFNDILQLSELELHQYRLRNDEINKRLKKRLKK